MSLNTDNLRSGSRDRQTSHQTTATARGNYDASCVFVSGRDLHRGIHQDASLLIRRHGMLDNSAVLDNSVVLLDNGLPVLDNNAALDNMELSRVDSAPVSPKFLADERMSF